jgi:putative membrane protein
MKLGGIVAMLVAVAVVYLTGVWRARCRRRPVPVLRAAAFGAGWLAIGIALLPPLGELAHTSLSAHMTQHEILVLIAAPLIVLGRPDFALALAAPARTRRLLRRLRPPRIGMGTACALHAVAFWAWHVPAAYEWALESPAGHALEHASFAGTAALFWWSVLGRPRARAAYGAAAAWIFATALHTSLLGVLLLVARRPWYPRYAAVASPFGLTPLEEQQLAGLVMWIPGGMLLAAAALGLLAVALRSPRARRATSIAAGLVAIALTTGCDGSRATARRFTGGDVNAGRAALRTYGCDTCHTIPGVPSATATVGPPLAGLASRVYVAGATNQPAHLMRFIQHPRQVRAGTPMPESGVSERDARNIAAYLYTLR